MINIIDAAKRFSRRKEIRRKLFGIFKLEDLPKKKACCDVATQV